MKRWKTKRWYRNKNSAPSSRAGVIQFLVERHSELLAALLDIKTEVFPRS